MLAKFRERKNLRDVFHGLLISADKKTIAEENYSDDRLVQALLPFVNQERHKRRLPPVSLEALARVEQLAVRHCDYGPKFSLYCAEIAMGEES